MTNFAYQMTCDNVETSTAAILRNHTTLNLRWWAFEELGVVFQGPTNHRTVIEDKEE